MEAISINSLVEDLAPQLGGALDVNEKFIGDGDADTGFNFEQAADEDIIRGKNAGAETFQLNATGILSLPLNAGFEAYCDNNQDIPTVGWTNLAADHEIFDRGGVYNAATFVFTTPVAGVYALAMSFCFEESFTEGDIICSGFFKNGVLFRRGHYASPAGGRRGGQNASCILLLAATDTIEFKIWHNYGANRFLYDDTYSNWCSAYKLG